MKRAVIFDLDGTLADTSGDLIAAANACFRQMGAGDVLDPARDAAVALRGGRRMLETGLARMGHADPAPVVDEYYPVLLAHYGRDIARHTRFFPGALEAVEALKGQGFAVGICTNKPEALAEQLLRELGVRDRFEALVGADTLPVRKPDPAPLMETVARVGGDPDRVILVGDSDTDRNTAAAAGAISVLVRFGPAGEDMEALEPEALLDDFTDLPALAARLLGPA